MKFEVGKVYQEKKGGLFPDIIYNYKRESKTTFSVSYIICFRASKDLEIQNNVIYNDTALIPNDIEEIKEETMQQIIPVLFDGRIEWN